MFSMRNPSLSQSDHLLSKFLTAIGIPNFGAEHVIATISKK